MSVSCFFAKSSSVLPFAIPWNNCSKTRSNFFIILINLMKKDRIEKWIGRHAKKLEMVRTIVGIISLTLTVCLFLKMFVFVN